jgi:hypothetical protein
MNGPPAVRPSAHTPVGDREHLGDRCVTLRTHDGRRPLHKVSFTEANELVNQGAAVWRRSREIWLTEEATPHNGNPCTWHGGSRPGRIQPGTYRPNQRVCDGYRVEAAVEPSANDSMNDPKRKSSQRKT